MPSLKGIHNDHQLLGLQTMSNLWHSMIICQVLRMNLKALAMGIGPGMPVVRIPFFILSLMVSPSLIYLGLGMNTYSHHLLCLGTSCDEDGNDLLPGTPPPPSMPSTIDENDEPLPFFPYKDAEEFQLTNFLFKHSQMPGTEIDELMQIWANTLSAGQDPPFVDHNDLYNTIDATILWDVSWQSFLVTYSGELPEHGDIPPWMWAEYDIWFHDPKVVLQNQLGNLDFKDKFDYAPFQKFNDNGK
jgi:Plavaka transposase